MKTPTAPIVPVRGRLFTTREAALYLGLSVWRANTLVASGDLEALRNAHGRSMGIYQADCDAWVAKHRSTPPVAPAPQPSGDDRIAHLLPAERRFA